MKPFSSLFFVNIIVLIHKVLKFQCDFVCQQFVMIEQFRTVVTNSYQGEDTQESEIVMMNEILNDLGLFSELFELLTIDDMSDKESIVLGRSLNRVLREKMKCFSKEDIVSLIEMIVHSFQINKCSIYLSDMSSLLGYMIMNLYDNGYDCFSVLEAIMNLEMAPKYHLFVLYGLFDEISISSREFDWIKRKIMNQWILSVFTKALSMLGDIMSFKLIEMCLTFLSRSPLSKDTISYMLPIPLQEFFQTNYFFIKLTQSCFLDKSIEIMRIFCICLSFTVSSYPQNGKNMAYQEYFKFFSMIMSTKVYIGDEYDFYLIKTLTSSTSGITDLEISDFALFQQYLISCSQYTNSMLVSSSLNVNHTEKLLSFWINMFRFFSNSGLTNQKRCFHNTIEHLFEPFIVFLKDILQNIGYSDYYELVESKILSYIVDFFHLQPENFYGICKSILIDENNFFQVSLFILISSRLLKVSPSVSFNEDILLIKANVVNDIISIFNTYTESHSCLLQAKITFICTYFGTNKLPNRDEVFLHFKQTGLNTILSVIENCEDVNIISICLESVKIISDDQLLSQISNLYIGKRFKFFQIPECYKQRVIIVSIIANFFINSKQISIENPFFSSIFQSKDTSNQIIDLRGLFICNSSSFCFQSIYELFQLYCFDQIIGESEHFTEINIKDILKLIQSILVNENGKRIIFSMNSANGIKLLANTSAILKNSILYVVSDFTNNIGCLKQIFHILSSLLSANYVMFQAFDLYKSDVLVSLIEHIHILIDHIDVSDISQYPKIERNLYTMIEKIIPYQAERIFFTDPQLVQALVDISTKGLESHNDYIRKSSVTFFHQIQQHNSITIDLYIPMKILWEKIFSPSSFSIIEIECIKKYILNNESTFTDFTNYVLNISNNPDKVLDIIGAFQSDYNNNMKNPFNFGEFVEKLKKTLFYRW